MTYTVVPDPKVETKFRKMWQKDSKRFAKIEKKLLELADIPEIGKPLKKPLKGFWRLHIGHFILLYKIDKKNQTITLVDYSHHDEAY